MSSTSTATRRKRRDEAALAVRQPPGAGELTTDTISVTSLDRHITRIEVESETSGKPSPKTVDLPVRGEGRETVPRCGAVRRGPPRYSPMRWPAYSGRTVTTRARQVRGLLKTVLTDAVLAGVIAQNPVGQLATMKRTRAPAGSARGEHGNDGACVQAVSTSAYCPAQRICVTWCSMLMGTGARISEVPRCTVVRRGPRRRNDHTFSRTGDDGGREGDGTPGRAQERRPGADGGRPGGWPAALTARAVGVGSTRKVFPSAVGTWRDTNNTARLWREWRGSSGLDIDAVSSHSWRRTLATVIDDAGLSARVAADQLGHNEGVDDSRMCTWRASGSIDAVADALGSVVGGTNKARI